MVAGRLLRLALVACAMALLAPTGCGNQDEAEGGAEADSTSSATDTTQTEEVKSRKKQEKSTTVNAARVVRGDLVVPVIAEGAVRARYAADVQSEITGRLDQVAVREGQTVRRGQLIAQLDNREYLVALEEARSQYLEAIGRLAVDRDSIDSARIADRLREQLRELERLERQGAITRKERLDREVALEVEAVKQGAYRGDLVKARSGLAAARAAQERAELDLEHTEIRAPFAGVVSELTLTAGERVTTDEVICRLVDLVNLEAEVDVLESDLRGLEPGRAAILEIPALDDSLHVQVDVMNPEIDAESRTCKLLLRFKNEKGIVRPGMFVRATIAGEIYPDRLLVPREAILTRDGRPLLFKVVDERAEWVYIRTGLSNDRLVEVEKVLQGGPLDPGMQVVVSDHLTLSHKAKVKVRKVLEPEFAFTPAGN